MLVNDVLDCVVGNVKKWSPHWSRQVVCIWPVHMFFWIMIMFVFCFHYRFVCSFLKCNYYTSRNVSNPYMSWEYGRGKLLTILENIWKIYIPLSIVHCLLSVLAWNDSSVFKRYSAKINEFCSCPPWLKNATGWLHVSALRGPRGPGL